MPVLLSLGGPRDAVVACAGVRGAARDRGSILVAFRRGPGAHLLIWLASFPLLWAASVFLTLVISFQLLWVDLVD